MVSRRGAKLSTSKQMTLVCVALLPGLAVTTWYWGLGILANCAWLLVTCYGVELICIALRHGANKAAYSGRLTDGTAAVTALTLAICLPPGVAAHVLLLAAIFAIGVAKHAYGGVGRNVFNPAMVGYAVILVSFPQALDHWFAVFPTTDALSGATQLSQFRYRTGMTATEFAALTGPALSAQSSIATAYLLGGLLLLYLGILRWRIPLSMLAGLGLAALIGYDQGSSASLGSWWFHITSGGFVAAAFFVATDPVTHPRHPHDQILFGLSVGILIYLMRAYSAYPDGIAFAILLANGMTPLLNRRRDHIAVQVRS